MTAYGGLFHHFIYHFRNVFFTFNNKLREVGTEFLNVFFSLEKTKKPVPPVGARVVQTAPATFGGTWAVMFKAPDEMIINDERNACCFIGIACGRRAKGLVHYYRKEISDI